MAGGEYVKLKPGLNLSVWLKILNSIADLLKVSLACMTAFVFSNMTVCNATSSVFLLTLPHFNICNLRFMSWIDPEGYVTVDS